MTRPTIVFAGDSVTDASRGSDPAGLGDGYVRRLSEHPALAGATVVNAGISGNRARDLRARWERDITAHAPSVVSVLIGVNDTWRRFDSDDPTDAAAFERDYRALLEAAGEVRLILIEPFLLPVRAEQEGWIEDLEEKIAVTHALAAEFGAALVRAHRDLTALGDNAALAPDGVHPSDAGHQALAGLWVDAAREGGLL